MRKTASGLMFPTRILLHHGGPALQKHGGSLRQKTLFGWEDLSGQGLIIAVNRLLTGGRISIRILASWICAAFRKIFITTIKAGGPIMMFCIFHRIGTGGIKEISLLMFG